METGPVCSRTRPFSRRERQHTHAPRRAARTLILVHLHVAVAVRHMRGMRRLRVLQMRQWVIGRVLRLRLTLMRHGREWLAAGHSGRAVRFALGGRRWRAGIGGRRGRIERRAGLSAALCHA
jgi:hypothetical protein